MGKLGLIPTHVLLDYQKHKYTYWLLTLPDRNSAKYILPVTIKSGNRSAQLGEQLEHNKILAHNQKLGNYGQHLIQQVSINFSINRAYEVEHMVYQKLIEF